MSNEITAYFKGRKGVCESVYQYDYGMVLVFDGIELPATFDCYFSNEGDDEATPVIGADNRAAIPNKCLSVPGKFTVHIPLQTGLNDSEVEYVATIKVINRARPEDNGTKEERSAISEAIAALNHNNLPGLVPDIVTEWLDEHPEATTTVQDGSLTEAKFTDSLKLKSIKDYVTPEMFGAVGDGVADDATAIQSAIDYAIDNELSFIALPKTYCVGSTINLLTPSEAQKNLFFDFRGCTLKAIAEIDEVLKVATADDGFGQDVGKNTRAIKNLIIDCQEMADYGIYHKMGRGLQYEIISISNAKVCAFYADGQARINMMNIDRRMYNYTDAIGIQLNGTDNKISNVHIRDAKIGVQINGASSFLTNVHCWLIDSSMLANSICFNVNANLTHFSGCYADTYETGWNFVTEQINFLTNCHFYINATFYNDNTDTTVPTVFAFPNLTMANARLNVVSCDFDGYAYYSLTGKKIKLTNYTDDYLDGFKWGVFEQLNSNSIQSTAFTNKPKYKLDITPYDSHISVTSGGIVRSGEVYDVSVRFSVSGATSAILFKDLPKPAQTEYLRISKATTNGSTNLYNASIGTSGQVVVWGDTTLPDGDYILHTTYVRTPTYNYN